MSASESTDPVASPEPSTPSSAVETSAPSQPEPKVSAEPPAPPAASDEDSAPHIRTSDEAPDEEEVLARLQGKTPKKDTKATPPAAAADTPPATPEAKADEAAAPEPTPGEFKLPEKAEIDAYHSKTRARVKGLVERIETREPFAKYGEAVLKEADRNGVSNGQLNAWIELGFLAKNGHPDALPILANILKNAGYKNADLAPAVDAQPQFDTAALEVALARAYDNADISESGLREIRKTLASAKPVAPAAKAPEVRTTPPPTTQVNPQVEALKQVNQIKAEYAAEHGPRWQQLEPLITKELAAIEAKITDRNVLNNPALWAGRIIRAAERVLNRSSAPATPAVTPSLRASTSPTPPPAPLQSGTAEYEEALLTGRIAVKKR